MPELVQLSLLMSHSLRQHDTFYAYNMKQYHISPRLSRGTLLAFSDSL